MSDSLDSGGDKLDLDFHVDAVICGCHDDRVKTLAPCYLCKEQVKDEQCYKCYKEGMSKASGKDELDKILWNAIISSVAASINIEGDTTTISEENCAKAKAEVLAYTHQAVEKALTDELKALKGLTSPNQSLMGNQYIFDYVNRRLARFASTQPEKDKP